MGKINRWQDNEKAHLQAHYPAISAQRLTEILPDRTARAIRNQAYRMGIAKCHERLQEIGRERVNKRWAAAKGVFKAPDAPPQ